MTQHRPSERRTLIRPLVWLVALAVLGASFAVTAPAASAAGGGRTITFTGRGWGHGRGLGQYGAFGYALNHGWTRDQILNHYYGGTTGGQATSATSQPVNGSFLRARLMAMDDKRTAIVSIGGTEGSVSLTGANQPAPAGTKAVMLTRLDSGAIKVDTGPGCAGPWTPLDPGTNQSVTVGRATGTPSDLLKLCRLDFVNVWYPGSIQMRSLGASTRTVNITTIEEYLRSVVPAEMPAGWHQQALQAQAVAARSYALAGDTRHVIGGVSYADTCDSTLCQVYSGHFIQTGAGSKLARTYPSTNTAIDATAGLVRLTGSKSIARTEFSSSTGGYTAGGAFPAVPDAGDAIGGNPNHTWSATVPVAALEAAYGDNRPLIRMVVTQRNGLNAPDGNDGGRVTQVRLDFEHKSVPVTGEAIRSRLALKSNWFTPGPVHPLTSEGTPEAAYIDAVHDLFLARGATEFELEDWYPIVHRGDRAQLTSALAVSDEWAGVQVDALYQKALGRPADPAGRAYWVDEIAGGLRLEDVAAFLYGSDEYFGRAGRTNRSFVSRLYTDILGRAGDAGGVAYWTDQLDRRRVSRSAVAANFYASVESRRSRVRHLYQSILGRQPDAPGLAYWEGELLRLGDVRLAAYLAASEEYYRRVTG